MKLFVKLSDKVLIIFFFFATALLLAVSFFIGGSLQQILLFGGFIYIFTFLITFFVSHRFSKKIINLTFKVEAIAAGDFSKKIEVKSKDEIGQLTTALNELMARLYAGVAKDVTKHKEINQAKTDFVALASHQLRAPLAGIKWYIDFVIGGDAGELNSEQKKYLKEVYKSNERLIELVNALLDVSRIDLGTFAIESEPTDLVKIAESVLKEFMKEIKAKKINLAKHYDQLPNINLDPRLMKIVFQNLISNAVKYTPKEGIIRIDIKKIDDNVFMKVADTGCGIPKEQQPGIFTKLFRADNVKKIESAGTGLGLYIVKAIVEQSGGRIWFESPSLDLFLDKEITSGKPDVAKNRGTTFFITIPLRGMKPKKGIKKLTGL